MKPVETPEVAMDTSTPGDEPVKLVRMPTSSDNGTKRKSEEQLTDSERLKKSGVPIDPNVVTQKEKKRLEAKGGTPSVGSRVGAAKK